MSKVNADRTLTSYRPTCLDCWYFKRDMNSPSCHIWLCGKCVKKKRDILNPLDTVCGDFKGKVVEL